MPEELTNHMAKQWFWQMHRALIKLILTYSLLRSWLLRLCTILTNI